MKDRLDALVERARSVRLSEPEVFEQRVSFAFGTAKIENDDITREMVIEAAKKKVSVTE